MEVETGTRAGDGGDDRSRTTNATINYKINGQNRFRGAGGGEDGRKASVLALWSDLRFEIQRPSWLSRELLWPPTMPVAPIRHPNPWGVCRGRIDAAGADHRPEAREITSTSSMGHDI